MMHHILILVYAIGLRTMFFNPNQNDALYLHFAICYRALDGVINNLLLW